MMATAAAIARSRLSAPVQALARWGFLDGLPSFLDYGCGRGDDIRALVQAGLDVVGWDPYYAPDVLLSPAEAGGGHQTSGRHP